MKLAFLGLGVMGYPMAGHLAKAGHEVTVYNRSSAKAQQWVAAHGGASAPTPAAAARGAAIVMMCVGNDNDVRAVASGAGRCARRHGRRSDSRRSHHGLRGSGARSRSGGSEQGRRLSRRAGLRRPGGCGERQAHHHGAAANAPTFARAQSVLATYARAVTLMGGPGSGQLTKMVNQICIAGLVEGAVRGHPLRDERGSRSRARARRHQQGRGAVVADGEPRQDHGRRQVRLRLRGRLDAQGPRDLHRPRRAATARVCRSRRWSTSSTRRCRRAAAAAGTRRALSACSTKGSDPSQVDNSVAFAWRISFVTVLTPIIAIAALAFAATVIAAEVTLKSAWMRPAVEGSAAVRAYVDISSTLPLDVDRSVEPARQAHRDHPCATARRSVERGGGDVDGRRPRQADAARLSRRSPAHPRSCEDRRQRRHRAVDPQFRDAAGRVSTASTEIVVRGLLRPQ